MTFYGKLVAEIKEYLISETVCSGSFVSDFIADIPKHLTVRCDIYSNLPAVASSSGIKYNFIFRPERCLFAENIYLNNGFLNIVLKEVIFREFLLTAVPTESVSGVCSEAKRYEAYLRLADKEEKYSGIESGKLSFSSEDRRIILLLAKANELMYSGKTEASLLLLKEACDILDKRLNAYDCIKSAVIENKPLISAAVMLYKKTGGL